MDYTTWFPTGYDADTRDELLALYPTDPHRAAADAWMDYAAQLEIDSLGEVTSVSTGAQTVTYAAGSSAFSVASARADWHAARSKVKSVRYGPQLERLTYGEVQDELDDFDPDSDEDSGVIVTAEYPPIGG